MRNFLFTTALCAVLTFSSMTPVQAEEQASGAKWSGRVNFGGFLTDGNSQKKSIVLDGMTEARDEKNRYTFGAELRYAEDEGEETEDQYKIYGEYDRFLSEKLFAGARLSYEQDDIADLDSRIQFGPYLGYQYYESEKTNLSTRFGVDYISDEFENGDKEEDIAATWGVDYDNKILDDALQIFYKHDLSVPFDDTEGFLFDSSAGVRFPLAKVLTGTAQIDFDWDNAPAPGVKEDDVVYSLKIGYEF